MDTLAPILTVVGPTQATRTRLSQAARPHGPPGRMDFRYILSTFLSGAGVPCEALFAEAEHAFDSMVDLTRISSPDFRARLFVWATTGSPFIGPDPLEIAVSQSIRFNVHNTDLCSGIFC